MSEKIVNVYADYERKCEVCEATPVVSLTGLCGPCTFGEAACADPSEWEGDYRFTGTKSQLAGLPAVKKALGRTEATDSKQKGIRRCVATRRRAAMKYDRAEELVHFAGMEHEPLEDEDKPIFRDLRGDAAEYVKAVFEGYAVRQQRLRSTNDSRAIEASNRNSRMLMDALKGHV